MKLSDLSTEKAADVLCEISVYTLSILGDEIAEKWNRQNGL